jgi:hypothetical protein
MCAAGIGCTSPFTVADAGGICVGCGADGQPCCGGLGGGWCGAPYACNGTTGLCEICGLQGRVCCAGSYCPSSAAMTCDSVGICE